MGLLFWKGIENAGFRERADGGWDYFPKGVWGRGYRVTAAQRAELQQVLRGYYKSMGFVVAAMIVVQAFIAPIAGKLIVAAVALLAIVPWSIALRRRRQRILGDAPPAEGRLSLADAQQATAEHISKGRALFLLIAGPIMTLGSALAAWGGWRDRDMEMLAVGALGALFFGFCTWGGVRIWRRRQRFLAQGGHAAKVFD
jgi:hypothetical protein